ncbi:MAG TPA: histidine kinase [Pyrinomonadaceae bacterium]|jgi:signal transduction histidine kinase
MLVSAAWIVPAAFAAINRVAQVRLNGWDPVTARDLIWESGDWLVYGFLTPGVFAVSRRWPFTRPHLVRRIFFHLGMSLVFCVAWATCGKLFQFVLMLLFNPNMFQRAIAAGPQRFWGSLAIDWLSWVFITLPFGVAVYLCVVGIEHASRYFVEARERDVQVARLSEQLAGAKFAALQAQVNPHFLFNTLNTIAVLVRDNEREAAVRIVEQLSEVLRASLSSHRENEVTLGEELELVRQYVAIEHARFSDRLRPEFNIDDSLLTSMVPSFSVQTLVENAIRHGIAKKSDAGRLIMAANREGDMLEVTVVDDGVGIDPDAAIPEGHGIANTRERLRALYGTKASLEVTRRPEGGTIARLRVPYHRLVPNDEKDS